MQRRKGRRGPDRSAGRGKGTFVTTSVSRAHSQAGFSLTESLAAILLVTLVILGVAAGILTTVRASRVVSETQRAEAALSDAAEVVKARPYQACADTTTYGPLPGATVTTVEYLRSGIDGEQFGPTCDPTTDVAQRITVVISGRTADVVKRDPTGVTP